MKASITCALLLALLPAFAVTAQAKPAPLEVQAGALSLNDSTINSGPSGAMLESAYFRAPPPFTAGRTFRCRLQLNVFDKISLARSC